MLLPAKVRLILEVWWYIEMTPPITHPWRAWDVRMRDAESKWHHCWSFVSVRLLAAAAAHKVEPIFASGNTWDCGTREPNKGPWHRRRCFLAITEFYIWLDSVIHRMARVDLGLSAQKNCCFCCILVMVVVIVVMLIIMIMILPDTTIV